MSVFDEVISTSITTSFYSWVSKHLLTAEKMSRSQMTEPSKKVPFMVSAGGKNPAYENEANITSTRLVSKVSMLSTKAPVRTLVRPTSTNLYIFPMSASSEVKNSCSKLSLKRPASIVRP